MKGVKSRQIADASIFPNNVSGNIQAIVYSVAEKAAVGSRSIGDYMDVSGTKAYSSDEIASRLLRSVVCSEIYIP